MKTIYQLTDTEWPLSIQQKGKFLFVVQYGQDVPRVFNNWKEAFAEFGYCLAHSLECQSKLVR